MDWDNSSLSLHYCCISRLGQKCEIDDDLNIDVFLSLISVGMVAVVSGGNEDSCEGHS